MGEYLPPQWQTQLEAVAPGITEQFDAQVGNSSEPWYQTLIRVLPTLVMTDYQRRILNVQIDRAAQGQPPLDMSQYGVGVNVGISADTQKLLIIGGLALVGLFIFTRGR
jgi:hypothetical protein